MKSNPFLSVILPTYNRKYCIARMIDSVLMQSFKDFELIIIDDGSTDETVDFLEEKYCDKRIRIVRKENGGVSSARNLGISLAIGKYITFVDSDDYLLDGFFEDIYLILQEEQYEVLNYGGYVLKDSHLEEVPLFWYDCKHGKNETVVTSKIDFIKNFCLFSGNSWACAKVFKTSLILRYSILFNTRIVFGEDLLFNLQIYLVSSRILTNPKKFYVCDNNTESLSRGMLTLKQKCENLLYGYQELEKLEDYKTYFAFNTLRHMKRWLWRTYFFLDKKEKRQIKKLASLAILHASGRFEKNELKIMKKTPFIADLISCLYSNVFILYSRMTFLHPICSPIIKRIKKIL